MAVDELDLAVEDGKITVFVGPSGCGKTTSLRMINRMIDPTGGSILLDGKDIRESDPPLLRRGIGYVIQHAGLFPHRTVLDNVATVPLLTGASKRDARAKATELLELVGLDPAFAKRYPAQLSGGQQQRVGVARALAADPPVLLMDEPFSAVDPIVRDDLQQQLLRLQSELDKTIVFVTHDIDEAIKLGDKVAVFRVGGGSRSTTRPSALLAKPADEFVSSFVGRDRGYRALGFLDRDRHSGRVRSRRSRSATRSPTSDDGWAVVVDADNKPLGWVAAESTQDGPVSADAPGVRRLTVRSGLRDRRHGRLAAQRARRGAELAVGGGHRGRQRTARSSAASPRTPCSPRSPTRGARARCPR